MSIDYEDALSRLSTSLTEVMTCIHHVSTAHVETTSKIKIMRVIRIKSRIKELEKRGFSAAEGKTKEILKMTGCN